MSPDPASPVVTIAIALIALKWLAEWRLNRLNAAHARAHEKDIPEAFRDFIDRETYDKSVRYTLAKSRFGAFEDAYGTAVTLILLLSGVLPWLFATVTAAWGEGVWAMAAFLVIVILGASMLSLPIEWRAQFRLEEQFGFNTATPRIWWTDRVKGLILIVAILTPLFALILKIVDWAGPWWWLGAWAAVMGFQLLMFVLAPVVILPWFNKFTDLEEGELRDRLLSLAEKTQFEAGAIQVMDGSKRSKHSNAFFTGFGKGRKIALFDTLIEQLDTDELEAVLAHEIGHYKRRHILKTLIVSSIGLLAGLFVLSVLASRDGFQTAFGFPAGPIAPAFLLFGVLSGAVEFWLTPLLNRLSRKHEYEADAYARDAVGSEQPLIGALRKLNEKNLSNLTPHPVYSAFHYSHPTLPEREAALTRAVAD